MASTLQIDRDGPIAILTLNRPDRLNALDLELGRALAQSTAALLEDASVRCVVLRGAGGNFCAGGDVKAFRAALPDSAGLYIRELTLHFHAAIGQLASLRAPVIASVAGVAAGGGFSLALAGDLVLAADNARFAIAYSKIGLPGDGSVTTFLPRRVGYAKAMELLLLAPELSANEALAWGLINRVISAAELERDTIELARRLAQGPTEAFGAIKHLRARGLDLEAQLEAERRAISACATTRDFAEGLAALAERRPPRFLGQ